MPFAISLNREAKAVNRIRVSSEHSVIRECQTKSRVS